MKPKDLRKCRKRLGWTQERLAKRLGVNRLYIVRREGGKRIISTMFSIAVRCVAEHIGS